MINDMPVRGNSRKIEIALESPILKHPDSSLARCSVFPHQVSLAGVKEVYRTCDLPLGGNSWQIGRALQKAILHEPNRALAHNNILPSQIPESNPSFPRWESIQSVDTIVWERSETAKNDFRSLWLRSAGPRGLRTK
jgi:hypothetical protein